MKIYGGAKDIYWIFIESVVEEREGSPLSQFRLNLLQKLFMFSAHMIAKVYNCTYKGKKMIIMPIFLKMRKLLVQELKKLLFSK
jgi:cytochrome b